MDELKEEMERLVAKYGRAAVLAAAESLRRRRASEITDQEARDLAEMRHRLSFYPDKTFKFYQFLQMQKAAGIPVKVSLEILERIERIKPENPWALVGTIMAQDYPGFSWGTRSGGPRKLRVEG